LQAEIDIYQTRAQRENAPMLERLQIIDDLLEENRTKLGRVIDLYISGSFAMDDLQERKKRLEDDIHSLENQRESLLETMEGHTLTPDQVDDLQAFAAEIHDRLDTASHAEKMQLFNFLNVTSSLTLEESGKVLNLQCTIRNEPDRFILKSTSTR
jgi:predicted  nucleic acid-binding Zn-ribbon protein